MYFFCCRCRSEVLVCGLFPGFGPYWVLRDFCECFEQSPYGRNLLLMIQNLSLLPRDIRFSTNEGLSFKVYLVGVPRICKSFLKFAYVVVCVCMGKVYSLLVRGVSRSKTLIPLILSQSGWMLYYNNK